MSRKRKASGPKFSLFHGPGLRLYRKWRCPECSAHSTEPIADRSVKEWKEEPRCERCRKKKGSPEGANLTHTPHRS